jgi:hypothetical protein
VRHVLTTVKGEKYVLDHGEISHESYKIVTFMKGPAMIFARSLKIGMRINSLPMTPGWTALTVVFFPVTYQKNKTENQDKLRLSKLLPVFFILLASSLVKSMLHSLEALYISKICSPVFSLVKLRFDKSKSFTK